MKKPFYQKLLNSYLHWIFLGVMFVSSVVETIANLGLISPTFTYIGTIAVLICLAIGSQILRTKPIPWITEDGQKISIKSLNFGTWLIAGGIILALWIPRFSSNSQHLSIQTPTTQIGPTPMPNAYEVDIDNLIDDGTSVLEYQVVNLDAIGPDEIVIRWEYDEHQEDIIALGGLDVVGWSKDSWQNIFKIKQLEYGCGVYWGEFGVINLFNDQTRQLVTWLQCGTGSFVSLEIYQYQGLGFLERIYKNPNTYGEPETQRWMESVPIIVDETLYVQHASELYKYSWRSGEIVGEKAELDLGSSGVTVEFWMDDSGRPIASPDVVTLRIGQYLYLKSVNDETLPWDPRIQVRSDGILEFDDDNHLLRAMEEGTSYVNLWGWEEPPLVTVNVIK